MLGKPLIMVKGTGMSTVVKENNLGVCIDFSKEGFNDGLDELIKQKDNWQKISTSMKEIYIYKYSWDIMSKRLINLYNEVLEDV